MLAGREASRTPDVDHSACDMCSEETRPEVQATCSHAQ